MPLVLLPNVLILCGIAFLFFGASFAAWVDDELFDRVTSSGCDFPIYDAKDEIAVEQLGLNAPYLIRNLIPDWPAFARWEKEELLSRYGQRVVRSGSESSIVHSGGVAEQESTLADMVQHMSGDQEELGNSFIFDTTILRVIPELNNDFSVPPIFQSWDNPANESRSALWHMLSLGPSKSGLSFHNHGKTWLAVVHGMKQWFIYPPGFDPPRSMDADYSPMLPVSRWMTDVYPRLQAYPKPPLDIAREENSTSAEANGGGFRPLECRQMAGDVLFLPSRWTHMTINVGETIAIGGQETLYDDARFSSASNVLKMHVHNYDAWKDLGLAQFNMASREVNALRDLAGVHAPGDIVHLSGDLGQLDALLDRTQDTWVVLYHDSTQAGDASSDEAFLALQRAWTAVAYDLRDVANVAEFDLKGNYSMESAFEARVELDRLNILRNRSSIRWTEKIEDDLMYVVDAQHTFFSLPMAKMHRGDHVVAGRWGTSRSADVAGLIFEGDIAVREDVVEAIQDEMKMSDLAPGSIGTTSVALRRAFNESLGNLKRALEIKPLQPELLNMVGEVAGLAHDFASLHAALRRNIKIVDRLATEGLAVISLASMYHKIGHNYIKLGMGQEALEPTAKALRALPTFLPAMRDYVFVQVLLRDRGAAEIALEQLRLVQNDDREENVQRLQKQVSALPWE